MFLTVFEAIGEILIGILVLVIICYITVVPVCKYTERRVYYSSIIDGGVGASTILPKFIGALNFIFIVVMILNLMGNRISQGFEPFIHGQDYIIALISYFAPYPIIEFIRYIETKTEHYRHVEEFHSETKLL